MGSYDEHGSLRRSGSYSDCALRASGSDAAGQRDIEGHAHDADCAHGEQQTARSEIDAVLTGLLCAHAVAAESRQEAQLAWLEAKARLEACETNERRLAAALEALKGPVAKPAGLDLAKPAKNKELPPDSPYGRVKCAGCGELGTMVPVRRGTRSGSSVELLVCRSCNNQAML